MLFGYVKGDRKAIGQAREGLIDYGVNIGNIIEDELSNNGEERINLALLVDRLEQSDTVIVMECAHICYNSRDLLVVYNRISAKGATLISVKEEWLDTSNGELRTLLDELCTLEQSLLGKKRLANEPFEGRKVGRKRGNINLNKAQEAYDLYAGGVPTKKILEIVNISRPTLYKYLRTIENLKKKESF